MADLEQQIPAADLESIQQSQSDDEEREYLLAKVGQGARVFVMKPNTMLHVAFGVWVQVIRLIIVLAVWYGVSLVNPETHMSKLDA